MELQEAQQLQGRRAATRVDDRDYFALAGGLNVAQTPLQISPGEMIDGINYELKTLGGYSRLRGIERFDGQLAPSQAPFTILTFNTGIPAFYPLVGNTVTGGTSAATGVVLVANVIDGTGLAGYVVLGGVIGTFLAAENLKLGANVFGVEVGPPSVNVDDTSDLGSTYTVAAREHQRALILQVPGSGPVRGVVEYRGTIYAFRNNIGATAIVMYKSTAAGWSAIPAYPLLRFTLGTVAINAGDVITGATSGNIATVARVVLSSGSWDAGTAAGYMILAAGSPAFVGGEILNVAAAAHATTNGVAAAPALLPGGSYDFRVKNFYGSTGTIRIYGCDGVNKAFEYQDGANPFYCPIESGMATDAPTHLGAHRGRLWLAFRGGSLQPSAVNDVAVFSALQGAAELGVGDDITGILEEMSPSQSAFYSTSTLFVFCANSLHALTGDGPNWILGPYAIDTGAFPFSIQRLGQGIFLDDRGFSQLQAASQEGNFAMSSFSQKINPLIPAIKLKATCSSVSRNGSLYRLFLNDGRFVSIGFKDNKVQGLALCDLGLPMSCAWAGEDVNQAEFLLLGGTNGYVYQMDSGVNIDGAPLASLLRLAYHFSKTPSRQKRYRRVQIDMFAEGRCTFSLITSYDFSDPQVQGDPVKSYSTIGNLGGWDVMKWDEFLWDSKSSALPIFKVEGSGLNLSATFYHSSTNEAPHTFQGVSLHKSMRRLDRNSNA